jgi:hypothetical protein
MRFTSWLNVRNLLQGTGANYPMKLAELVGNACLRTSEIAGRKARIVRTAKTLPRAAIRLQKAISHTISPPVPAAARRSHVSLTSETFVIRATIPE